ncbi:MAG: hypothetical protein U1E65_02680 [Myxococcota bacterium]
MRELVWTAGAVLGLLVSGCGRTSFFPLDRTSVSSSADAGACAGAWTPQHEMLDLDGTTAPGRVFVDGHRVIYSRPRDSQGLVDVLRKEVLGGSEELITRGDHLLLEADAQTVLLAMTDGSGRWNAIRGGQTREVGGAVPVDGMIRGHHIDGTFVGGCTSVASVGGVDFATSQRFETLIIGGPCSEPTSLLGRHIVYLTRGGAPEHQSIVHFAAVENPQLEEVLVEGSQLGPPVLFQGEAYYLDGDDVRKVKYPKSGPSELVKSGPCLALDADAQGVLLTCDPVNAPAALPLGSSLWFSDGNGLRRLQTDGRPIYEAHLGAGFAAYLSYDPSIDFCTPADSAGRVMVTTLDHREVFQAASINGPCLCCNAFWPLPFLEARGDMIAFNYDHDGRSVRDVRIGVVTLERSCP